MQSGLNLSATAASVRATKGVGTTMSTTSQVETTAARSPVALKLPGRGCPAGRHTRTGNITCWWWGEGEPGWLWVGGRGP